MHLISLLFSTDAVNVLDGKKGVNKSKVAVNVGNLQCQGETSNTLAIAFTKSSFGVLEPDSYCAMRTSAF